MKKSDAMVLVKLVSADPAKALMELSRLGIALQCLEYKDDITIHFRICRVEYKKAVRIMQQRGDLLILLQRDPISYTIKGILERPILMIGAILLIALTAYIPTRIFFVTVEGNSSVTARQIIDAAEKNGLSFGTLRKEVRSEKFKNALLAQLPELQWVGINTKGCVAYISVRERLVAEQRQPTVGISSIIANCDGVIQRLTVTSGNPVCKVGQVVKKGQLLVSGYSDCGICLHGTRAAAEIFADTQRELTVITPAKRQVRASKGVVSRKYCLLLGKKRINFCKDSRISDTTCDKMYMEYYLGLPGGFRLPIGIAAETFYTWEMTGSAVTKDDLSALLADCAQRYLSEQMVAGTVVESNVILQSGDNVLRLGGIYQCSEMIGKTRYEEIIDQYGETN